MKFFAEESNSKESFDLQVEREFNTWLLHQNQRVISELQPFMDRYLKWTNDTGAKLLFRYRVMCGNLE